MAQKKRILIVEDNLLQYKYLEEILLKSLPEIEIVRARAVDEAIGEYTNNGPFDCMIVDLSITAYGLTVEEMVKYRQFEGYGLLKEHIWGKDKKEEDTVEDLRAKTIICSGFIDDFKQKFGNDLDCLKMVSKQSANQAKEIVDYVTEILK